MSTLELENIKHPDNSGNNIALNSNGSMVVDRQSTDGTITEFRRSGTTVGSIGVNNLDNFTVQGNSGHSGIEFGTNAIFPHKNSANVDNTIDLGEGGLRWKDLYLSGGVYLGGTGSANKLDDYEEGTWTPSPATGSWTVHSARYTKVGRLVNCAFKVTAAIGGTGGDITGLPFTALDGSGNGVVGFQNWDSAAWTVHVETTKVSMRKGPSTQTLGNATSAYVTFTYFTA
jgi:hypothetical protein